MRKYEALFERQALPHLEKYQTTRVFEAKDMVAAMDFAEQYAVANTREFRTQNGSRSHGGKMWVLGVRLYKGEEA